MRKAPASALPPRKTNPGRGSPDPPAKGVPSSRMRSAKAVRRSAPLVSIAAAKRRSRPGAATSSLQNARVDPSGEKATDLTSLEELYWSVERQSSLDSPVATL